MDGGAFPPKSLTGAGVFCARTAFGQLSHYHMSDLRRIIVTHRSVANVRAEDRHDLWLHSNTLNFSPLFDTTPLTTFNAESDVAQLGELILAFADITGQRWQRNADHLRSRASDSLSVNISLDIQAQGRAGERAFSQGPGSAVLTDLAQTSCHESSSGRSTQIVVSRPMAIAAGLDVHALHGLVLPPAAAAMLRSHLNHLREALPYMLESEGPRAARTMLDMLVLAVNATGRAEAAALGILKETLALRVRNEIRHNLGSASLTVANLCRRLQISRSTLHRLFDGDGGVQAYIRQTRLAAAMLALDDPANEERISAIAERLGFSDAAHFSRTFRERYGESPSDYRARQPKR